MRHFVYGTFPMQTKRISCDAEVGNYKRGWHCCNRKAMFSCIGAAGVQLDYCKAHEGRARMRKGVQVITD